MQAKDIMTREVVTISADATVQEAARLLVARHVSAVPVTDKDGRILGIVSEGDLLRRPETGTLRPRSWWLELVAAPEDRASEYVKSHGTRVRDVMTKEVISVGETASLGDIAHQLEANHIKRVPVVKGGKLVGIVSRADLLRGLATRKTEISPVSESDRTIREALLKTLEDEDIAPRHLLNVVVANGVVHLWGIVENDEQRNAVRIAAENTPGAKRVESHLKTVPAWVWGE
ncbi:MAG: CBS domain-containing protein [Proteobacteria bacterium]|nr:CBS domain-containing protein [Pseudomonadota bacterium]